MKRTRINGNEINKIIKMTDNGFDGSETSKILGISYSCVQNYITVVRQIRNHGNYCINPAEISEKAIAEYCEMVGLKKPENLYNIKGSVSVETDENDLSDKPATDELELVRAKMIDAVNSLFDYLTARCGI